MNTIYIEGRLVREPEFNYVEKGDTSLAIVNLTIAENIYAGKDQNGDTLTTPLYHRVVAFGEMAEKIANEYNMVGREYKIKGKLIPNNYEKDGKMIRRMKIKADHVENGRLSKKLREENQKAA
jgi:single-stranded DNA-binding protein